MTASTRSYRSQFFTLRLWVPETLRIGSWAKQENYPADAHTIAHKSVLELANPARTRSVHLDAPGQWHGQQPVSAIAVVPTAPPLHNTAGPVKKKPMEVEPLAPHVHPPLTAVVVPSCGGCCAIGPLQWNTLGGCKCVTIFLRSCAIILPVLGTGHLAPFVCSQKCIIHLGLHDMKACGEFLWASGKQQKGPWATAELTNKTTTNLDNPHHTPRLHYSPPAIDTSTCHREHARMPLVGPIKSDQIQCPPPKLSVGTKPPVCRVLET